MQLTCFSTLYNSNSDEFLLSFQLIYHHLHAWDITIYPQIVWCERLRCAYLIFNYIRSGQKLVSVILWWVTDYIRFEKNTEPKLTWLNGVLTYTKVNITSIRPITYTEKQRIAWHGRELWQCVERNFGMEYENVQAGYEKLSMLTYLTWLLLLLPRWISYWNILVWITLGRCHDQYSYTSIYLQFTGM